MRIGGKGLARLGGFGISVMVRHWMKTLRYRSFLSDPSIDPALPSFNGPVIFLFWHEYIPFPFYLRGRCNIAMLLSRHRDAELLSHAAKYMGFKTVRGSTKRGGVASLRQLIDKGQTMNLTMTPDGPRGPRRTVAPGCVYLSSKLQIPLVCLGFGYDNPWRISSAWDNFAIPRPFSRARMVASPRMQVPENLDREGIESYRQYVESALNEYTDVAEKWATDGTNWPGQRVMLREPSPLVYRRAA